MVSNKNIFYASNPSRISDALWHILSGADLENTLVFLPSRRAVRGVEQMLVKQVGHAVLLPKMVALGEGPDFPDDDIDDDSDVVSDTMRVIVLAKLLSADANIGTIANAFPLARDLVRMTDYLENEGVNISDIDWNSMVDDKFATHFQHKAKILNILSDIMPKIFADKITRTARRNADIRKWIDIIRAPNSPYKMVVVCASTASVPATADLMVAVAGLATGRIILSGKINGRDSDFVLPTNPYNAEYKFLSRIGCDIDDITEIDVGSSETIDFMNVAFSNDFAVHADESGIRHCKLIECTREATEATVVAEITTRAKENKKSVLVITPDAAGNQRIASAFAARGIVGDFSGGMPGSMTIPGRAILNMFDDFIEHGDDLFMRFYRASKNDLFQTIINIIDSHEYNFAPEIDLSDDNLIPIICALREMSESVLSAGIELSVSDARALVMDAISGVSVRGKMADAPDAVVLGTIESRMQTADVVILTGLNDGMFPARGYENAWLPRQVAEKIGLPSPDRKVSLMSLDFMNLSCGADVYWVRSRVSGGVQTTESRFISRVLARAKKIETADDIVCAVRKYDDVESRPLNKSSFAPPPDWSDVYVTELEKLIHNPYVFYASHILKLRPRDDYWLSPDARTFGNLVHDVVEHVGTSDADTLVKMMDARALEKLSASSVQFYFWHKRFVEIAPVIAAEMARFTNAKSEIGGWVQIAGRRVRARADRVWPGGVMDIKTGSAPSRTQLQNGTMPQLPLEAYMLQSGGFPVQSIGAPVMRFLQLKNNDVRVIEYDAGDTAEMINAAINKTTEIINMYSAGGATYEYRDTNDAKYRTYDDLARTRD